MELDRYVTETQGHCLELIEELELFGINRLAELCRNFGEENFGSFCTRSASDMCNYIEKTPSKRKIAHKNMASEDRALFVLGALFHARCGWALLDAIMQHGIDAGPPYRVISSQAAQAAYLYSESSPTYWPFQDGQDPFDASP